MPEDLAHIFALSDFPRVETRAIAGRLVAVVDDVYRQPDLARRFALGLDFDRKAGMYPGRLAGVAGPVESLLRLVNGLVPDSTGRSLAIHPDYCDRLTFAVLSQPGPDLRPLQRQPHFDGFCDFAAVLYLSRPEDCQGGTSFWRHRRTGLEYAPCRGDLRSAALLESFAARDEWQLISMMMKDGLAEVGGGYLTESNGRWERLDVVEMHCNRLLLYDARLFHSAHVPRPEWRPDPERPRLTQNLYLNRG
ncbi:MAG TPA: DUF6445 family protein [Gemmataceae bacterium]|nr:DUF6445 family protein [Gemmataceae bacterium]